MLHSMEALRALILSYGPFGPLVAVGLYVLHSFVPFPAQVLTFAIGAVYGPVWGTLLAWLSAMAGAQVAFLVARLGGRPLARRFVPARHLQSFDRWVQTYGTGALLLLRLIPIVPFNLINYAAGLTEVSLWTFTWTTGLGIIPLTALGAVAADQLLQGNAAGLWLMGALLLFSAAIAVLKRRHRHD